MMRVSLRVQGGKHDGQIVSITTPKFLIGREDDCHLRPNSDMISRHHCAFTVDDYAVRLRDLGSTNGTYVNGERIRGVAQLNEGDEISVGKLQFRLVVGDSQSGAPKPEIHSETGELSGAETHYEMPIPDAEEQTVSEAGTDTAEFTLPQEGQPAAAEETVREAAATEDTLSPPTPPPQPATLPPQPVPQYGYPQGQYPQGQYPQPQYPQQPGYYPAPPPMGYPPQMGGYYPQFPQQAYPFPQPVVMGQQPMPGYLPQQQEAPPSSGDSGVLPETRLPDPAATGVQPPAEPPPSKGGDAQPPPAEDKNPSDHAADIIRQHLQRRTGDE